MELFTVANLKELLEVKADKCVSFFLPTHRSGAETQQDPIRLKNLIKDARTQLTDAGMRTSEIDDLLAPAMSLVEDTFFWRYQSDGLCVFLAPQFSKSFRLPSRFPEVMVVNKRFHLKPLIQFYSQEERFFLLRLGKDSAALFLGSRNGLDEIKVTGMPLRLSEVVAESERNGSLQTRSSSGSSSGPGAGMFHGHFDNEKEKEESLRFFRAVDGALKSYLRHERAPLLLCGGDPVLHLYRSVNSYGHTLGTELSGSFGKETSHELFERALPIVKPTFEENYRAASANYQRLVGTGKTTKELEQTLVAASGGRVESLFVPVGEHLWGRYDSVNHKVTLEDTDTADNEDLLDRCARETLLTGGTVFAVNTKEMPDQTKVAAVLRF